MNNILSVAKKIFSIALYSVRQRIMNPRVICLFILMLAFIWNDLSVVGKLTDMVGIRINPLVFPFFSSDPVKQLILFASIVFLYSDAPFIDKNQPYVILRSKRIVWALGQVIHIIMFSAVYFSILMVASVLIVLPNATFTTNGWGKVINTLAQTNAGSQIDLQFGVSEKIISLYSPFESFALCFLLNLGMSSFLGLLIFAINLKFGKMIGSVIGGVILFFDLLVLNALPSLCFYFSPLSLSRLSTLDPKGISTYPSVTYAFVFYTIGILIFSAVIVLSIKRKSIEISSES